jgi:hypothetical protein
VRVTSAGRPASRRSHRGAVRATFLFLESAQPLGGLLSHALAQGADTDRLTAAVQAVNAAARPLLASLDLAQRTAVDGDG